MAERHFYKTIQQAAVEEVVAKADDVDWLEIDRILPSNSTSGNYDAFQGEFIHVSINGEVVVGLGDDGNATNGVGVRLSRPILVPEDVGNVIVTARAGGGTPDVMWQITGWTSTWWGEDLMVRAAAMMRGGRRG